MSHQDMGFEDMEFPGVSKSMWNFQGLIKNKVVEFPRVTKKISSSPQGSGFYFVALEFPQMKI